MMGQLQHLRTRTRPIARSHPQPETQTQLESAGKWPADLEQRRSVLVERPQWTLAVRSAGTMHTDHKEHPGRQRSRSLGNERRSHPAAVPAVEPEAAAPAVLGTADTGSAEGSAASVMGAALAVPAGSTCSTGRMAVGIGQTGPATAAASMADSASESGAASGPAGAGCRSCTAGTDNAPGRNRKQASASTAEWTFCKVMGLLPSNWLRKMFPAAKFVVFVFVYLFVLVCFVLFLAFQTSNNSKTRTKTIKQLKTSELETCARRN